MTIDTGFDGFFVLPLHAVNELGPPEHMIPLEQADGSVAFAPSYIGIIDLLNMGSYTGDIVVLGDEYIVGRTIIDQFKVTLDHGQRLIVEA